MSPHRLDLQILCKSGASIARVLASWGTLPLIVRYKGRPKTKSLPKNIAIALCHPDRVREIDLGLTSTTVGSIVDAIRKPFQTLECIQITITDATYTGPSLQFRNIFLGGSAPRLRKIALDGVNIPFPEIKQVISSTNNLVELHLSGISKSGYFSVDALVNALSTSAQLKELQVGFRYPASLPTQSTTSPPLQRTTFPSLWLLEFHGASEYLEELMSRVDFPSLSFIVIELFNQIFFEIPQLCRSIPLLNSFNSPTEVEITLSTNPITTGIDFRQKGMRGIESGHCYLRTDCERLDWKLSFVTQVSNQLSLLFKSVDTLRLIVSQDNGMPSGEDVDSTQWLELFQPFTHVRELRVSGQVVPDIVQALVAEDMVAGVLPELTQLFVEEGDFHTPTVVEAAEQFVAVRKLSGRTISLSI